MKIDLTDILSSRDFSRKDKVLSLLMHKEDTGKQLKDLRELAVNFGLREAQKWNLSQILSSARGLAVKIPEGWILTQKGKEYLQEIGMIPSIYEASEPVLLSSEITRELISPIFGVPQESLKNFWADIFMIMPFRDELNPVYTDHILKVVNTLGLSCERGDDFFSSQSIIDEIWAAICFSKLCIADCTGRNPNVFYELGMAHTVGKTVILITQSIEDIPFDIRHRRSIIYEYTPRGMEKFESTLRKTLENEFPPG